MQLESVMDKSCDAGYNYDLDGEGISFRRAIREIVRDVENGEKTGIISARFHNCIASAVVDGVKHIFNISGINDVVLCGGTFQNRYLAEKIFSRLEAEKFNVYYPASVPVNDGGLALGQLAIAAARRNAGLI